mmetsp:Transcript_31560/g.70775  ORF Transcript_31560/g.70775 Transcript_31560/m.70775 type:complete len:562 (-) Transcript_31560:193-1878(-)
MSVPRVVGDLIRLPIALGQWVLLFFLRGVGGVGRALGRLLGRQTPQANALGVQPGAAPQEHQPTGDGICHAAKIPADMWTSILLQLGGVEALRSRTAWKTFKHALDNPTIWDSFCDTARGTLRNLRSGTGVPANPQERYKALVRCQALSSVNWMRRRADSDLIGEREGAPGLFLAGDFATDDGTFVCLFGGWGFGPQDDLHMMPVRHLRQAFAGTQQKLLFNPSNIAGDMSPLPAYGQAFTALVDDGAEGGPVKFEDEQVAPPGCTLVLVSGGHLSGGYRRESRSWALLVIAPTGAASWVIPPAAWNEGTLSRPQPRAWHQAVYVAAQFCGPEFPKGCVISMGGNVNQNPSNTIDILDLASWTWAPGMVTGPKLPRARNAFSAGLVRLSETEARVIMGPGGTGGDVPRGGEDCSSAAVLDPRAMQWLGEVEVAGEMQLGRAASSCVVGDSLVMYGGCRYPHPELASFNMQACAAEAGKVVNRGDEPRQPLFQALLSRRDHFKGSVGSKVARVATNQRPESRGFGGGVSLLPVGLPGFMIYGGWHPRIGTFGDFWLGRIDGQ